VTRETCYQGESASDELAYAYSGVTIVPTPYDVRVEAVRQKVQALFPDAPQFNTCLLNYYRSGAQRAREATEAGLFFRVQSPFAR
jgi:hypothetical protein